LTSLPAGFYGIADAGFGDPLAQARILAEEGVGAVQLRCKSWPTARLVDLARALPAGPLYIVNDDVAVAREAGLWVHVGQEDGPDPAVPFGRSTHDLVQASAPGAARYVGFGPVFGTRTKDTGYDARGIALLAAAVRVCPVPVVAIGGVEPANVAEVRAAGAHAWTAIGAVWKAPDPRAIIRALR
jgi:thiamine-phosphate pyrophosphorylase